MRQLARLLVTLVSVQQGARATTHVLLGRGDTLAGWTGPSGLSSVALSSIVTPWSGLPFFNSSYDFSDGSWSATLSPLDPELNLSVPGALSLSFSVFSPVGGQSMLVSLTDAGGGSRGGRPRSSRAR